MLGRTLQFELSKCHFLVDLDLPVGSPLEPRYAQETKTWKTIAKYPFLDPARWVWLHWSHDYCLLYVYTYL